MLSLTGRIQKDIHLFLFLPVHRRVTQSQFFTKQIFEFHLPGGYISGCFCRNFTFLSPWFVLWLVQKRKFAALQSSGPRADLPAVRKQEIIRTYSKSSIFAKLCLNESWSFISSPSYLHFDKKIHPAVSAKWTHLDDLYDRTPVWILTMVIVAGDLLLTGMAPDLSYVPVCKPHSHMA